MAQGELFATPTPRSVKVHQSADTPHQHCVDFFHDLYLATRGIAWSWTAQDTHWIRLALKEHAKGEEWPVKERIRRMLTDPPSRWFAANAAPILVYRKWNELGVRVNRMSRDEVNASLLRKTMVEL